MPKIITRSRNFLLDVLFPPQCLNCKLPILDQSKFLCQSCFDEIELNSSLYCPVCMARRPEGHFLCHDSDYLLAPASRFFPPIPKLIHSFKYSGLFKVKTILSGILIAYIRHSGINVPNYSVTYIPLHKSKQRMRGFNQAQILAENVADYFNAECLPLLERILNNKQQAKISDKFKRKENVSGCFQTINAEKIAGKNILLVDDVSTSGSTLDEASKILKKYGARKIICLVVAKA